MTVQAHESRRRRMAALCRQLWRVPAGGRVLGRSSSRQRGRKYGLQIRGIDHRRDGAVGQPVAAWIDKMTPRQAGRASLRLGRGARRGQP